MPSSMRVGTGGSRRRAMPDPWEEVEGLGQHVYSSALSCVAAHVKLWAPPLPNESSFGRELQLQN